MRRTARKVPLLHFRQVDVCTTGHTTPHTRATTFPQNPSQGSSASFPIPSRGMQNKMCHLPTHRGKVVNNLDQFRIPALPSTPTPEAVPSPGARTVMRGVPPGWLDECAVPHFVSGQREHVLGRGHGKKSGEPTPRGHSWGNKLATSIARLPREQAWI